MKIYRLILRYWNLNNSNTFDYADKKQITQIKDAHNANIPSPLMGKSKGERGSRGAGFPLIILIFLLGVFLYGDVMYETFTKTEDMMGIDGSEIMSRMFIKGDYSRMEATSKSAMAGEVTSTVIVRFDTGVMWVLDSDNKQYSEIKLGEATEPEIEKEDKEETEIVVEKTGKKKVILEKECEEVVVSMKIESDDGNMNFTQTLWVTKDIPCYEEINDFTKKLIEKGVKSSSADILGGNQKSFEEFQKKIQEVEGFPLEHDMEMTVSSEEMSFSLKTHSTVTKIDDKPIDQKVFEIPEGYSLKE